MAELLEHGEDCTRKPSAESNARLHRKCKERLAKACRNSAYVRFMLDAMSRLGCDVDPDKHFVCEPCDPKLVGGFDHDAKEMFLCENAIYTQSAMENVLTHELIHAYDNCRIKYDPDNVKHLACTEIRAANLSGDCWFSKEAFGRFKFRWRAHQQECVKTRAVKSMLCVRNISKEEAEKVVESVFDACFHDTEPFERIPP
ncbi:mitochondrial inner membrane protease ATP23 homolog [Orbicella faveolata]|uniref:mitochondrial inner membrane protease ATP23 homolog n=1 Tax=Orbicella faveolata TaxID=48498 RepID=UPI0009E26BFC|nr:mitochondrial inner membrane protease ATP23 homolog [Orbicella faveolata]